MMLLRHLPHFKRDIPCVGCLAVLLGGQPRGHHKSLHSPYSHTSPANTFIHCVWLKQELPQASQSLLKSLSSVSKQEWMKTVWRMVRVKGGELGWGPESFKTGRSDKEIASLPHCLHPYCILVTSKVSFQNSISKIKSIRFIFLNVSIFPCCFCLVICSAPCCDPQWNHRDTSCWMGFRFAILSGKKRREQWKKDKVMFFWCNFCLQTCLQNSYVSNESYWYMGWCRLAQLSETGKPSGKFSCSSSTGWWLCSCAMEAQFGETRGFWGIWTLLVFVFFVVFVILRHLQINTR